MNEKKRISVVINTYNAEQHLDKVLTAVKDFDEILICDTMLRAQTDMFLDETTLEDVRRELGKPIRVVQNNGESLIRALWGLEEENG